MPKSLWISSGDGCLSKKQPALLLLLSTSTSIDVKGCMSSGHLRVRIFTLVQKPSTQLQVNSYFPKNHHKRAKRSSFSLPLNVMDWTNSQMIAKQIYIKNITKHLIIAHALLSEFITHALNFLCIPNLSWTNGNSKNCSHELSSSLFHRTTITIK